MIASGSGLGECIGKHYKLLALFNLTCLYALIWIITGSHLELWGIDQSPTTAPFRDPKTLFLTIVQQALHSNSRWRHQVYHQCFTLYSSLTPTFGPHRSCPCETCGKPVGQQQACTMWCRIICQANLYPMLWEFMSKSYTTVISPFRWA